MSTSPSDRRRGRRPGGTDTRVQLLDAARIEFAERGYDGATVRRIAQRAGVDPAMVNHWFGGKDALFTASISVPIDPAQIREQVLAGGPERVGERIVTGFLQVWDATGGGPMTALIQSVAGHDDAAGLLREFLADVLIGPIVIAVAPDETALRASLAGSQMIGLGMARYVLKLEPLASADHPTVVAVMAPTLQRYLTGPLR